MPIRSEDGHLRGLDKTATSGAAGGHSPTAQQDEADIGASGIGVPLRGPEGHPSVAHVLPLARGDVRTRLVPQALAAVFVNGDGPAAFIDLDAVARSFEFTPAETRLAHELLVGRTVAEAASALGIGESTAKTYLQNVFTKSGVSRQVDLITLLLRLIPVARRAG